MLTSEQISQFKQDGFLIIRGAIEPVYVDAWRRSFWDSTGGNVADPSTWTNKQYVADSFKMKPPEATLSNHRAITKMVEQLGGGKFVGGAGTPLVQWPSGANTWSPTPWGHIDGYPPSGWGAFMLGITAYAYDVDSMGGAFTYWPQSHLTTHRFFLENPHLIDGHLYCRPDFNWGGPNDFTKLAPLPSREFTASAGDVILWHAFLVHTGSANIRTTPRVGMFARYTHQNQNDFKYEVPQNLWKYWAI